mmetsp:Transcript_9895/g.27541  ORF Transcript_9895/g.27541 Transcript_9895/m.27541 type:complete len:383 (-) Transcript_9895:129-1277(-)
MLRRRVAPATPGARRDGGEGRRGSALEHAVGPRVAERPSAGLRGDRHRPRAAGRRRHRAHVRQRGPPRVRRVRRRKRPRDARGARAGRTRRGGTHGRGSAAAPDVVGSTPPRMPRHARRGGDVHPRHPQRQARARAHHRGQDRGGGGFLLRRDALARPRQARVEAQAREEGWRRATRAVRRLARRSIRRGARGGWVHAALRRGHRRRWRSPARGGEPGRARQRRRVVPGCARRLRSLRRPQAAGGAQGQRGGQAKRRTPDPRPERGGHARQARRARDRRGDQEEQGGCGVHVLVAGPRGRTAGGDDAGCRAGDAAAHSGRRATGTEPAKGRFPAAEADDAARGGPPGRDRGGASQWWIPRPESQWGVRAGTGEGERGGCGRD